MPLQLYKWNNIEWSTHAFHCQRIRQKASTVRSFFHSTKTVNKSSHFLRVATHDCYEMARKHMCDLETLIGQDGVFTTKNKLEFSFEGCCEYKHFGMNNCTLVETNAYKQFGKDMEYPVGDVSRCRHKEASCSLEDLSLLIWNIQINSTCQYAPWHKVNGKYQDSYFV